MYCQRTDLNDYVLEAYLTAADGRRPGIVDRTLENVSGEINDALRSRFELPLSTVPDTLRRIAAVLAAYRIVGAITSLMDSESGSNNEWLPLQTQYKQALRDLEAIRDGTLPLGLAELGEEAADDVAVAVVSRKASFGFRGWR